MHPKTICSSIFTVFGIIVASSGVAYAQSFNTHEITLVNCVKNATDTPALAGCKSAYMQAIQDTPNPPVPFAPPTDSTNRYSPNPVVLGDSIVAELNSKIPSIPITHADLTGQSHTSATPVAPSPIISDSSNLSAIFSRSLRLGFSGADVSALQACLAKDPSIYPEGLKTGYFGSLTEKALQRWQTTHNIVSEGTPDTTGFGVFGPRTRPLFIKWCMQQS